MPLPAGYFLLFLRGVGFGLGLVFVEAFVAGFLPLAGAFSGGFGVASGIGRRFLAAAGRLLGGDLHRGRDQGGLARLLGHLGRERVTLQIARGRVVVAALGLAHVEAAALALAHQQVGGSALRAGLRHRPRAEVLRALRVARAAVERPEAALALQDLALVALRAGDAGERHGLGRLVAAVRVVRARDVLAEAAVPLHEVVAAHRALLAGRLVGLGLGLAARHAHRDRVAAFRVGGAAEEARAVPPGAQPHRAAALVADLPLDFGRVHGVLLGLGDVQREGALRVAAARDEEARLAHPELERVAALGAGVAGIVGQAEVGEGGRARQASRARP